MIHNLFGNFGGSARLGSVKMSVFALEERNAPNNFGDPQDGSADPNAGSTPPPPPPSQSPPPSTGGSSGSGSSGTPSGGVAPNSGTSSGSSTEANLAYNWFRFNYDGTISVRTDTGSWLNFDDVFPTAPASGSGSSGSGTGTPGGPSGGGSSGGDAQPGGSNSGGSGSSNGGSTGSTGSTGGTTGGNSSGGDAAPPTNSPPPASQRFHIQSVDALGHATTITYDGLGRLTGLEDASGNATTWGYDAADRLTSQTEQSGAVTTWTYDSLSRVSSTTDAVGRTRAFGYDSLSRQTSETWTNTLGVVTNSAAYTWSSTDRLLSAGDASGSYAFGYDGDSQLTSVAGPFAQTMTFGYDDTGNRTSVTDSFGGAETSTYGTDNRLLTREYTRGATTLSYAFSYDSYGVTTGHTQTNSVADGATTTTSTQIVYDEYGREASRVHRGADGAILLQDGYQYDDDDRVTARTGSDAATYGYNANGELTAADDVLLSYDATGNRIGSTIGADNALVSDGVWNYTRDAVGNTTGKSRIDGGGSWAYQYDTLNHLTRIESRNAVGDVTKRVDLDNDVFGNRIARREYSGDGDGGLTLTSSKKFAFDGFKTNLDSYGLPSLAVNAENFDAYADLNADGSLDVRRIFGNTYDSLLGRVDASGVASSYLTDRLGSVSGIVGPDGTLVRTVKYNAFGQVRLDSNPAFADRYGFTGREVEVGGLMSYRDRYLDTNTTRFLTKDRMGFAAGDVNLYRYVGNDFVNAVDPSGNAEVPLTPEQKKLLEQLEKKIQEQALKRLAGKGLAVAVGSTGIGLLGGGMWVLASPPTPPPGVPEDSVLLPQQLELGPTRQVWRSRTGRIFEVIRDRAGKEIVKEIGRRIEDGMVKEGDPSVANRRVPTPRERVEAIAAAKNRQIDELLEGIESGTLRPLTPIMAMGQSKREFLHQENQETWEQEQTDIYVSAREAIQRGFPEARVKAWIALAIARALDRFKKRDGAIKAINGRLPGDIKNLPNIPPIVQDLWRLETPDGRPIEGSAQ